MASVRVAVRVRPLNKREKQLSSKVIVHVKGNTTSIVKPAAGEELKDRGKTFSYDFSYDSTDRGSPAFASQGQIFRDLGSDVLKAAFEGFNVCVFAYGQTGSGKSYTMMGQTDDKGLIPRICEGFFSEISQRGKSDGVSFVTEVSYFEIYNERVQDLLRKRTALTDGGGLRVREHPSDGPYVENLSKHLVHSYSDMEDLIILGNANRTTASTGMNNFSSRSHAIFTVHLTQAWLDAELPREILSKIHLVDLAGSERANATRTTGTRFKEGTNINKSLVTLGTVISSLADLNVSGHLTKKKRQIFIPYRDSVLTWLLKDSLGGNSVTTMIATISPADVNYSETLSTLRYASRAKNIVNSPTVNEDGSVKAIRELQAEVSRLQGLLEEANQVTRGEPSSFVEVEEELHQNEAKVLALTQEWTSKWAETQGILQEQTVALRREGSGVSLHCQLPHLIGIDEDLLSTGVILYYLKEGRTLIGSDETLSNQGIVLHGPGLLGEHCVLDNRAGTVTLIPQEGALCSVNGSVVTAPCQLTQGAITKLGKETILRFNHPAEAGLLRGKCQSEIPPASHLISTDASRSTKDLSEMTEQNEGQTDVVTASKTPSSCFSSSSLERRTTVIPGKYPVPHTSFELDGDTLQGGVSTRDGQERERDSCHKSGPEPTSEWLWREAQSGDGDASHKADEVWSGDASLQQTSVLGPGDGCGAKPEGNANEIQGVVADCYKGRPGSSGSSLGSKSHLQSSEGTSSTSVLPQTRTHSQHNKKRLSRQVARCPPEDTTFEGDFDCGEMDESGGVEDISRVCLTDSAAAAVQTSRLGSLVSRVSWIVHDVGRLLWSSSTVLQQVREEGLQPVGTRWSSHVVSMVRKSSVLSIVNESKVFSMVKGSIVFSLLKDSHIFSMVKELPLIQHIQMTQNPQQKKATLGCIDPDTTQLPVVTPTQSFRKAGESPVDMLPKPEDIRPKNESDWGLQLTKRHAMAGRWVNQEEKLAKKLKGGGELEVFHATEDKDQTSKHLSPLQNKMDVQISSQTLIKFPDSILSLQTLPLLDLMDTLHTIIPTSVLISQKIVAVYWLNVAKYSQPEPRPGLLILLETGLYTLTTDTGLLLLFHHLSWMQLKEVQISFGGHSLRLISTTEDSILGVYTHSQKLTKELCRAMLGIIHTGDSWVSQHPLLHGDLMKMSLDWETYVPDLLLDAGLRVCCQFQKSLADLVYLLHCNMDQEMVSLGQVRLLLYTGVGVCLSHSTCTEHLAQLLLTDTHLGLVQEDAVFNGAPCSVTTDSRCPQFHDLILRQRSDVRCVLVHDEDERGVVRLDVILANGGGRGHPESTTKATTLPPHVSDSSPRAEVWKLTFSCSSEAACLINHLSNG